MTDPDYKERLARFKEYDRKANELRRQRMIKMPWHKRIMFVTIGDILDKIFKKVN